MLLTSSTTLPAHGSPFGLYTPPSGTPADILMASCSSLWSGDRHALCPPIDDLKTDQVTHLDMVRSGPSVNAPRTHALPQHFAYYWANCNDAPPQNQEACLRLREPWRMRELSPLQVGDANDILKTIPTTNNNASERRSDHVTAAPSLTVSSTDSWIGDAAEAIATVSCALLGITCLAGLAVLVGYGMGKMVVRARRESGERNGDLEESR